MAIKIIDYRSIDEFNRASEPGFSQLHIDFVDNIVRCTWVNGTDDPRKIPPVRSLTQANFIKELAQNYNVRIT